MKDKIAVIILFIPLLGCGLLMSNSPMRIGMRVVDQTNIYPSPNAGKAMVYFYHDPAVSVQLGGHYIYQDGVLVGAVRFSLTDTLPTYFFLETAPGAHTYTTGKFTYSAGGEDSNDILSRRTLNLESGKTYYFRVKVPESNVGGFLEIVASEEGEQAVRNCQYAILKPEHS
jgi:hypothetical protein